MDTRRLKIGYQKRSHQNHDEVGTSFKRLRQLSIHNNFSDTEWVIQTGYV